MVAHQEQATLAERLIAETATKQGIEPDQLTLHADRGSAMTAKPVACLLADLGSTKTHSRPHVSNDNPSSEAQCKTLKYRPDFPARFDRIEAARVFCQDFFPWYNTAHRPSGLGLLTPEVVHYGAAATVHATRRQVLHAAYAAHPERFVRHAPEPPSLPTAVWINPPQAATTTSTQEVQHYIRAKCVSFLLTGSDSAAANAGGSVHLKDRSGASKHHGESFWDGQPLMPTATLYSKRGLLLFRYFLRSHMLTFFNAGIAPHAGQPDKIVPLIADYWSFDWSECKSWSIEVSASAPEAKAGTRRLILEEVYRKAGGPTLTDPLDRLDALEEGMLIKGSGQRMYFISEGRKRWIPSQSAFASTFRLTDVVRISDRLLGDLPNGPEYQIEPRPKLDGPSARRILAASPRPHGAYPPVVIDPVIKQEYENGFLSEVAVENHPTVAYLWLSWRRATGNDTWPAFADWANATELGLQLPPTTTVSMSAEQIDDWARSVSQETAAG